MNTIARLVTVLLFAVFLSGHDMWLETQSFIIEKAGQPITIQNGNGTIYQKSENAVAVDRIAQLIVLDPSGSKIETGKPYIEDAWTRYTFTPKTTGNYWMGLASKARNISLSGEEFTEYLKHDGIPNVLKERKKKGISDRDEVERYSKYVKAYLQVGDSHSDNFDDPLGLAIEIIPQKNLYLINGSDILPVQVLFQGNPLSGLTLHAGFKGQGEDVVSAVTDRNGMAKIKISNPGKWYIRGIHLFQVDQDNHSYESYWATLTFEIQ